MKIITFITLICFIVCISATKQRPRIPKVNNALLPSPSSSSPSVQGSKGFPPLPNTPLQFTANMKYSVGGDFPESFTGAMYYDFVNQRVRMEYNFEDDTSVSIMDFLNGVEYTWDIIGQDCYCDPPFGAMEVMFIPYGAIYAGEGLIGINPVTIWNFTDPTQDIPLIYQFNIDAFNTVLRVNIYETEGDFTYGYTIDFTNITLGQPDPNAFVALNICKCDDPMPPPPAPATCPDAGLELCQCPTSANLRFCSSVNYPVSSELNIIKVDQYAQATYNSIIATISNPTDLCKANFQAYLCSFYFAVCGEEEDDENFEFATYLPCASMCTSCSCGDTPLPLNCTAAPASAAYCTTYVKGFC